MKERLLNNIGLKLLSVVCAIVFWGVIINVNDPSDKATVSNIPVNLQNTSLLTDNGYLYEVENNTDRVSIVVKGPRSIVENLRVSDFYAQAQITNEFADTADITVKCINGNIDEKDISIELKNNKVKLNIQNLVTKNIDITPVILRSPATGYYTDNSLVSISPNTIRISGPANVVDKIEKAKVMFDVTGENTSTTVSLRPILYDMEDKIVDAAKVTLSKNEISYKIEILKLKNVKVNYAVSGEVAPGYKYTGMLTSLSEVTLAGYSNDVDKISSIDIPASLINIEGLKENKNYNLVVSQYVPGNVKYITTDTLSNITVQVEELLDKTVSLVNDKISVKNLGKDMRLEFLDRTVNTVTVRGIKKNIEEFSSDDLQAEIDLKGLQEGEHSVNIKITTNSDLEVVGNYKLNIKISKQNNASASEAEMED